VLPEEAYIEFIDISARESFAVASIDKSFRLLKYEWVNNNVIYLEIFSNGRQSQILLTFSIQNKQLETDFFTLDQGYLVDTLNDDPTYVLFAQRDRKQAH